MTIDLTTAEINLLSTALENHQIQVDMFIERADQKRLWRNDEQRQESIADQVAIDALLDRLGTMMEASE